MEPPQPLAVASNVNDFISTLQGRGGHCNQSLPCCGEGPSPRPPLPSLPVRLLGYFRYYTYYSAVARE